MMVEDSTNKNERTPRPGAVDEVVTRVKRTDCESRKELKWHNSRNLANGFLCRYGAECGTRPIKC